MELTAEEQNIIRNEYETLLLQSVNPDIEIRLQFLKDEVLRNLLEGTEKWLDEINRLLLKLDDVFDFTEAYLYGKTAHEKDIDKMAFDFEEMIRNKNHYYEISEQYVATANTISFHNVYIDELVALTNFSHYVSNFRERYCIHEKNYPKFIKLGMENQK